ncbi:MAG: hypothetical protein ABEJ72_02285 [Candidatus Aenigmatarchaeota archaeon]
MKHREGVFKSCVGPIVTYDGAYEEFSEIYNECLDECFDESEYSREKETYKSYDFMQQFAEQKEELLTFLKEFFGKILAQEGVELKIVYSKFSKQALDGGRVQYYSSVNYEERSEELNDFIDELKRYFPVIATFKALEGDNTHEVFLDSFSGEVTKAWDSLINTHNVDVLTHGDKTNKLISLSDLISKYLGEYLNRFGNAYIGDDEIRDALGSQSIEIFSVDNRDLDYIVPHRPDEIAVSRYYPSPKFLVLIDNTFDKQKEWFENSKYYDLVCRAAETRRSSVKFLDLDSDANIVNSEDFLVYTGPKSKKDAEQIANFDKGKPLPSDNIKDML